MNDFKVVCYHTPNGIYPEMAARLKTSCTDLNVSIDVDCCADLGSWVKNCAYKAKYIKQKLTETANNSCIVWIDSDAKLMSFPNTFGDCSVDFAVHAKPGAKRIKPAGREFINIPAKWKGDPAWFESGTIFFRKTESIMNMVDLWIAMGENTNKWDQWTLQEAWCEITPTTLWLDRSYCQINKMHGADGAVILHDLASVIQKVNRT